jgi:predicted DNA-binding protein YlxM (UPF0122 family)
MQYKMFSEDQFELVEDSVFEGIERIKKYIKHYTTLLSYTKQSVRRKKLKEELKWWEVQLVEHEEMAEKINKD